MWRKEGRSEEAILKALPDLQDKPIPAGFDYLVTVFRNLSMTRQWDAMGNPMPITFLEIKSYQEVMGDNLEAHEVELIKAMDVAYVGEVAEQSRLREKSNDASRTTNPDKGRRN